MIHKLQSLGMGLVSLMLLATAGCRAHQLQNDQEQMRVAIIDMYTNQVMDNLIRAYNGYPFVQVDYTNVTGTITQEGKGGLSGLFHDAVAGTLDGSQSNQLTVSAGPVLQDDQVYEAYLKFAGNASNPTDRFFVTCEEPPSQAAHMCVCRDKMYYWIPKEQAYAFQNLALQTTVMRGNTSPLAVRDYFIATIKGLVPTDDLNADLATEMKGEEVRSFDYLVEIDEEIFNNQSGRLRAVVNGMVIEFEVGEVSSTQKQEVAKQTTESIHVLRIKLNRKKDKENKTLPLPVKVADLQRDLPGQSVEIHLDRSRPSAPLTPNDTLKSIRREMELFRLNQQRVLTN